MSPETQEELQEKIRKLEKEVNQLKGQNKELKITVENQKLQIQNLNRYIFGSKRELTPKEENIVEGTQCSIFGEIEDEKLKKQVEEKTEEIVVHRKKKSKTVQSGIKKSELKNIEQETIILKLEDDSLVCPKCGSELTKIGTETVRQEIQYIPSKLKVVTYVREVYKCTKCGKEENEKETLATTIVKAKTPRALLSHSFASSSLATEVIYQKYYMGVPLYRQEQVWDDRGLILPRSMTANWCIRISQYYLQPIYEMILKQIKKNSEVLHCDETTIQCNKEPGKKATSNSYMWVLTTGENEKKKGVIYKYSSSRSGEEAQKLLKDYSNILVTDGYAGYNSVEGVNRAECWAHTRRYFYESIPLDSKKQPIQTSDGYTGVKYIDELFEVEREIENLSAEEKVKERQEKSAPILKKFYEWVYSTSEKYVTNSKLQKALTYAINQKENLSKFLDDGRIPLTNSKAERAVRPFAVHRKNWLFADSQDGAKANAIFYSLIESAKANKLNIYKYINYLLEILPQLEEAQTEEDIEKYLPWSKELPAEVLNFQGEYKEIEFKE